MGVVGRKDWGMHDNTDGGRAAGDDMARWTALQDGMTIPKKYEPPITGILKDVCGMAWYGMAWHRHLEEDGK